MVAERSRALALVRLEWTVPSMNPGEGNKCFRVVDGELSIHNSVCTCSINMSIQGGRNQWKKTEGS